MDALASLQLKGYEPQTSCKGMGWLCTIEVNSRVQQFYDSTEGRAINRAVEYVRLMEERYEIQMSRLRCEGCGE